MLVKGKNCFLAIKSVVANNIRAVAKVIVAPIGTDELFHVMGVANKIAGLVFGNFRPINFTHHAFQLDVRNTVFFDDLLCVVSYQCAYSFVS